MGGDHKCPVCQATFTRPQHVARHMRSHTGDRPYKCTYCGDQFARSDLLSRHVNKCHANEKPPPSATNSRRKGSASASRATTSKQACDQCVQSSLPCDGCNPCAKCVQRKCRCTFVKFHRQTAPVGPGHHNNPTTPHINNYPPPDEFILGPPPLHNPNLVPTDAYGQALAFPQMYSSTSDSPSFTLNGLPESIPQELTAKYRLQAELLRRTGAPNGIDEASVMQGLYADPQATSSWLGWAQDDRGFSVPQSAPAMQQRYLDKDMQAALSRQLIENEEAQYSRPSTAQSAYSLHGSDIFSNGGAQYGHPNNRRGSVDFNSDDSHSPSMPSSAASSNLHLPLVEGMVPQQRMGYTNPPNYPSAMPSSQMGQSRQTSRGEGGFSNAFGLMSLDDPNVIAGFSTDGAPFFSSAAMSMTPGDPGVTPMPMNKLPGSHLGHHRSSTQGSLNGTMLISQTPGITRETETRELREFWRAYMQTPLTGPGPSALENGQMTAGLGPMSPSGRRQRVASLPSVKTPPAEGSGRQCTYNQNGEVVANGTSSLRTTLHGNADDLRSYEAAVMARKAPTLNLVPRRRGNTSSTSPQMTDRSYRGALDAPKYDFSSGGRSIVGSSSTLSCAFGRNGSGLGPQSHMSYAMRDYQHSSSSRESSVSIPDAASDAEGMRPSFKRLASQTLVPGDAKRAHGDEQEEEEDDEDDTPEAIRGRNGNGQTSDAKMSFAKGMYANGGEVSQTRAPEMNAHPRRAVVSLSERRRRMSAPTAPPPASIRLPNA